MRTASRPVIATEDTVGAGGVAGGGGVEGADGESLPQAATKSEITNERTSVDRVMGVSFFDAAGIGSVATPRNAQTDQ